VVTVGKFIAKNERLYASQKWRVVWVLRIYVNAMRLCWLSRSRDLFTILIPFSIRYLKPSISIDVLFLKQKYHLDLLLGKVFSTQGKLSLWVQNGGLGMVPNPRFMIQIGC